MTDNYDFWRRALAGEEVGGPTLPVHDGEANCGFWRKRASKAGSFVPVAIWKVDTGTACVVDGQNADASDVWSYCCRFPVSEEHYRERMATGRWFDEDESVTASLSPPPAGHNQPDERATLADQIDAALKAVETYKEVKTDEAAAKAQSARSRLLELSGDADKKREKIVRPFLDGQNAANAEWMPLVKNSKAGADTIKAAIGVHETRKLNAAKASALALAKKNAEEAAKHAPLDAFVEPMPVAPPVQQVAPAPLRGAYGRGAARRVVKIATVKDQDAAYGFLKAQPELAALILKLAQKMVDAGLTVPGVDVTEEVKVS